MSVPFRRVIKPGAVGLDVVAVKRALKRAGFRSGIVLTARMGKAAVLALKRFQVAHSLTADGKYGPATHKKFVNGKLFDARGEWLMRHAKIPKPSKQQPPLPKRFSLPNRYYPRPNTWNGLQPWIVPQIKAFCEEFNLRVTAGWASSGHAGYSDHYWGGAADLAGSHSDMVAATKWAEQYEGSIFRWVGGPDPSGDGVEHGHGNHVHLSFWRDHATTIFITPRFKD